MGGHIFEIKKDRPITKLSSVKKEIRESQVIVSLYGLEGLGFRGSSFVRPTDSHVHQLFRCKAWGIRFRAQPDSSLHARKVSGLALLIVRA